MIVFLPIGLRRKRRRRWLSEGRLIRKVINMDIDDTRKACKRLGVKFAEANDRIYNEPPSMSFISRKHKGKGGLVTKACGPDPIYKRG